MIRYPEKGCAFQTGATNNVSTQAAAELEIRIPEETNAATSAAVVSQSLYGLSGCKTTKSWIFQNKIRQTRKLQVLYHKSSMWALIPPHDQCIECWRATQWQRSSPTGTTVSSTYLSNNFELKFHVTNIGNSLKTYEVLSQVQYQAQPAEAKRLSYEPH